MKEKRILFVCTGNSCRSVMAEGLLTHLLRRAGITGIQVESAGIFAIDGMTPTRETVRVLQDNGVDVSAHRARTVTPAMIEAADLILVMEQFQAEEIIRRLSSVKGKTHLLKTYSLPGDVEEGRPNIPDPIGKPLEVYEVCFAEIREAVERLAQSLGVSTT